MNYLFQNNMKHLRKERNMSQARVARIINKERSLIGHWENGSRKVMWDDLVKLSEFFNLSIDQLIGMDLTKSDDIKISIEENALKKLVLEKGARLYIDKKAPLSSKTALKIQKEVQKILLEEI